MLGAISAVFLSWESNRAKVYRKLIKFLLSGNGCQCSVNGFWKYGWRLCHRSCIYKKSSDGSNEIYGEYLINAQGEDVVAGTRTPQYITKKARQAAKVKALSMEESMPSVYKELYKI